MTSDIVLIGTDTDAGKTTFALLFLAAFPDRFAYWKPVETGTPDSGTVRRLLPEVRVHPSVARFEEPVAPALAAVRAGRTMPTIAEVLSHVPAGDRPLLIETFGGPFSPFDHAELQLELIRQLARPVWLVTSSAVGAIGRTLQTLVALAAADVHPTAVILLGPPDAFAEGQIRRHAPTVRVVSVEPPTAWDEAGIREAAMQAKPALQTLLPEHFWAVDRRCVWHPYTSLHDPILPLPVVAAEREFVQLADGRRLIDATSSWWTILHGHCHPPLVAALRAAAGRLDHVIFAGVTHPAAAELAELLLASAPWAGGGRVFYSDNGSTAIEVALKMAYQFWCHRGEPGRTLFIGFDDGYHGDTFGPMALSRDATFFGRFEPLLFRTERVPVSPDRLDAVLTAHPGRVAAVVIEPLVQAAGGMKMHTPATLRELTVVCQRHKVLFIADEVMTANRTGTIWAHTQAGVSPDIIAAGKTLTGGMLPLAVTLAAPHVVAEFATSDRTKTFFHGHSFTANPLACAVALANWHLLRSEETRSATDRIRTHWQATLSAMADHPAVADVRLCGTVAAVELRANGGYLADIGQRIRTMAIEHGVLLRPLGNVVYALPPLCTSADSLARIGEVMMRAVEMAGQAGG